MLLVVFDERDCASLFKFVGTNFCTIVDIGSIFHLEL